MARITVNEGLCGDRSHTEPLTRMAIVRSNSVNAVREEEDASTHHQNQQQDLDAGALFVLKSKGSWVHCGYHLTTSIVTPALLSLPLALSSLSWVAGIISLVVAAMVTFYSYNLLFLVLEHQAQLGKRQLRFRDMARDILGPRWGRYYVGPIQFLVCYGAVVSSTLLGGQCLKAIYLLTNPQGELKLFEFVMMFGVLLLFLAQLPSFHSLRHINLVSLVLCPAYSFCAAAGSIYLGKSSDSPPKDYTLTEESASRVFGIFNGIAIIATALGNGIIPEIQATAAPPVKGKMFKGLCVCYALVSVTFLTVAVSGYWAFGNKVEATVISNFMKMGKPLVPKWLLFITNFFTLFQLSAVSVIYLQPTNESMERAFADPNSGQFSARNVVPRLISRSSSVAVTTVIAAMLPFFGDINALLGAFGFIPLDFILPAVFFNFTFKPSKRQPIFWVNAFIAVVFSVVGATAAVAAVRQISLDAKTYRLFANI